MKALFYNRIAYALTAVVFIVESIIFWKCVDIFKSGLPAGSYSLPGSCIMVLRVAQDVKYFDVFGIILLFCLGIRQKPETFGIICLVYLILWSGFILSCICGLRGP